MTKTHSNAEGIHDILGTELAPLLISPQEPSSPDRCHSCCILAVKDGHFFLEGCLGGLPVEPLGELAHVDIGTGTGVDVGCSRVGLGVSRISRHGGGGHVLNRDIGNVNNLCIV